MVDSKLPTRLSGLEEELNDGRINHCFQFKMIDIILKALRPKELARLKQSSFGMLLNLPSMSKWGAGFTHYLLRKQLVTDKKYELWFLFGGKPWRFSLREFGMVTGLCCGKLPKPVEEHSYWDTLFIKGDSPNVHWVSKKLSSGAVQDPELRIQYACLLLVHGVLCPTSRNTPISREYVQLVRDVDAFLAYPWGRVSFRQTLESIKSKDVDLLTQQTAAITGFPYALQLVAMKAIPEITYGEIRRIRLKLVSDVEKSNAKVVPLIEGGFPIEEEDLCWSDEEKDEKVDYLMELVAKKHCFSVDEWDVQSPVVVTSPAKGIKKRPATESWVRKDKRTKRVSNAIRRVKVVDVEAQSLESSQEVDSSQEVEACVVSETTLKGSLDGNAENQVTDEEAQGAELCEQGEKESNRQQTFATMITQEVRSKINVVTSDLETKIAAVFAQEVESRIKVAAMDMETKIAREVQSRMKVAAMDMETKIAQEVESRMLFATMDMETKIAQEVESRMLFATMDMETKIAQEVERRMKFAAIDMEAKIAQEVESRVRIAINEWKAENVETSIPTYDGRKGVSQELAFIDRVQTKLEASDYEQVLKSLYLFSKKTINRPTLDSEVSKLIGAYPELMQAFKDFLVDCEKYEGLLLGIVNDKLIKRLDMKLLGET